MTPSSPPEVVARTPAGVEMEFAFVVASNVDWAVTVALPGATEAAEAPAVRNDLGVWTVLESGREVRVIGRSAPSNGTLIRVRVRLPEGASTGLSDVIRFSIEPADGLPGE